jgi:hypothetical protein
MSVYSERFFGGELTATDSQIAVVPAGSIWILRDLELLNLGVAGADCSIYAVMSPGGTATVFRANAVPQYEWRQWEGRVVLNAGDTVHASFTAGPMQLIVSGYSFPA